MRFENVLGLFLVVLGFGVIAITYAYSFAENSVTSTFATNPKIQGEVTSLFNQSFALTYAIGGASLVAGVAILCIANRTAIYPGRSKPSL